MSNTTMTMTLQERAAAALAESRKARVAREREDAAHQEQQDAEALLAALTTYIDWACQRHANDE